MQTIFGWVMTLVLVSLLSAGLVSLSLYAPQKTAAYDIAAISAALGRDTTAMLNQVTALGGSNPSTLTVSLQVLCFDLLTDCFMDFFIPACLNNQSVSGFLNNLFI